MSYQAVLRTLSDKMKDEVYHTLEEYKLYDDKPRVSEFKDMIQDKFTRKYEMMKELEKLQKTLDAESAVQKHKSKTNSTVVKYSAELKVLETQLVERQTAVEEQRAQTKEAYLEKLDREEKAEIEAMMIKIKAKYTERRELANQTTEVAITNYKRAVTAVEAKIITCKAKLENAEKEAETETEKYMSRAAIIAKQEYTKKKEEFEWYEGKLKAFEAIREILDSQ